MAVRRGIHDVLLQTTASGTIPSALSSFTNLGETTVEGVTEDAEIETTSIMGHTLGNTALSEIIAGYSMQIEFTLNDYKKAVSTIDPFLQWLNTLDYGSLGPNIGQHLDASLQRTILIVPKFSVSGQDLQRIYYRVLPAPSTVKRLRFDPRDIVRNPCTFKCYPTLVSQNYLLAADLSSAIT